VIAWRVSHEPSLLVTFLLMNDWEPAFDEEEFADVVLAAASGAVEKPELIRIFESRCRPIGDSPPGPVLDV
jgi:prophage maintenance system killer protein